MSTLVGTELQVEYRSTDKYGRTVARIRAGATDIGARMVLDGFAVVYLKYCPSLETDYYTHEAYAKQRRLELWGQPGLQVKPWVWRRNQ